METVKQSILDSLKTVSLELAGKQTQCEIASNRPPFVIVYYHTVT